MTRQRIQVFGAPWCPDCRQAKQFLNEQRIPYEWTDVDQNPEGMRYVEEVNKGKHIIPTILFPDGSILVEPSNAELAQKLGIQTRAQRTYYDLAIVGSGPAGLTAAIYAAREGVDTLVIERSGVGGQAAITQEIENYPGFPAPISGRELGERLKEQAQRFGVEILPAQAATRVSADGSYRVVTTEMGDTYCASAVLLATGAAYRRLNVPGEEDYIGAGVHFCATCDGPYYKGKEVLVVGGGNSGFQEGLFLTRFATKVTIVEIGDQVKASRILQEKVQSRKDMEVFTRTAVQEFKGDSRHLTSVAVKDLKTGGVRELTPAGVFVFIGLQPGTAFLKGTLDLDQYGFIKTSPTLETSLEGVFAAGDCRAGSTKQAVSAAGEGATAALMIREYLERLGEAPRHQASA
jgi:thioredoxin reductase (NADPH)